MYSDEFSNSDHRQIRFDLWTTVDKCSENRVPILTDWTLYNEHVSRLTENIVRNIDADLETRSKQLYHAITTAYENSSIIKNKRTKLDVS